MVNPYESPQLPDEDPLPEDPGPLAPERPFTLQYEFDDVKQRTSALTLRGWRAMWSMAAVLPLVGAGFFVGRWLSEFAYLLPTEDDSLIDVIHTLLWALGFASTLALLAVVNRLFAWQALQRLRNHPVLAGLGEWRITIGTTEVLVETPSGQQSWPLEQVRYLEEEKQATLWLEPLLPIALPLVLNSDVWIHSRARDALRERVLQIAKFD